MIIMKDVSVVYDGEIQALKEITLSFQNQKCIGIIGENGSGKSTLLSSLVGLIEHSGEIIIDDVWLDKNSLVSIREKLGLVFQNPDHMLFLPSVKENLAFGLINQGYSQIEVNHRTQEIAHKLRFENLLERNASHLSGGQKRMVSLASVLVMQPQVLLLDEPSAFLDPKSRRHVINVMKELKQQIIFSTHDLDMALDLCDEIVLLNNGKIIKVGTPQEILTDENLLLENGLELPYRYQR